MVRSSITNTRKFIQKTIENLKSFFSNGYRKLPKSPHRTSIDKKPLCTDLTFFISQNNNSTHHPNIIIIPSSPSSSPPSPQKQLHAKPPKKQTDQVHEQPTLCSRPNKIQLVRQKLEELEIMIDAMIETDHVSDVQEFLHFYSRLRCPAYLDIVEQFFMEMCSEFLVPQLEPPQIQG